MRNFELEIFFSKWEFKAKYHLTASDMESMSTKELLAMASSEDRDKYENLWLGYTQTYGLPELRSEIASTYDNLKGENILCFAGAEEGLYADAIALVGNVLAPTVDPDNIEAKKLLEQLPIIKQLRLYLLVFAMLLGLLSKRKMTGPSILMKSLQLLGQTRS